MQNRDMDQYYTITLETPIFLYGYTKYAQDIACSLVSMSYKVKGYIDIMAKQLEPDELLPIFSPEDLEVWQEQHSDNREIVVIICLQNIITQVKVAEYLLKKGIHRVIFASDTRKKNCHMASEMRQVYQKICLKENLSGCLIPKYNVMLGGGHGITEIKRFHNYVCILCPIQLIYTGTVNTSNSWQVKDKSVYEEAVSMYADKNIIFDKLYGSFFDYMMTGAGDCDAYVENYAKMSNKSRDAYFRDRVELFRLYEREYENNFDFFKETAAIAEWNPRGYFNLKDGHHRAAYLYKKGHRMIPVIISTKDLNMYINPEKEVKLERYLSEHNIFKINNAEISNRFEEDNLYDFQIREMIARWNFLAERINVKENSYLDASDSFGFFAINMSRMHAENVKVIVKNAEEENLLKLILELTYQENILIEKEGDIGLEYDIVFTKRLTEKYNFEELYSRTKKYAFFAYSKNDRNIRERIRGMGDKYQNLLEYFDGEKWMESGVVAK